ncbi:MAG: glycosyltransferase [Bacteroidales bacterium]|nr:glycosyltransferase [Candidatus Physcousia equi]
MKKTYPLITIVTVTYNAEKVLERTLFSVEAQSYPRIEHIIIDAVSQDGTLSLVRQYVERNKQPQHNIRILSEPDRGLYDAMNKSLTMAEGDYIVFLNAGDTLHADDTIEQLVKTIEWEHRGSNPAVVYGETDLVDDKGNFLRHRRLRAPESLHSRCFLSGMLVCHQSFFVRTDLARQLRYDMRYRFSADFDWCIRIMKRAEKRHMRFVNTHLVLTDYLSEGMTTHNHTRSLRERFRIMCHHYGIFSTVCAHLWFVIRAVFKR